MFDFASCLRTNSGQNIRHTLALYNISIWGIKMKNILDELYDCDLFHLTEIGDADGEYNSMMNRLIKAESEILKACIDCKEMFEEYQSADIDLHDLLNRFEFCNGVRVGAQIVLEMIKPIE